MQLSKLNIISAVALLVLGGGVFLTVQLAQQNQENRSRASAALPVTVTLKPVADATVSSNSTSNSGSSTKLGVDADSPTKISYLKYDLSSLAGATITSVVFRFRVGADPAASDATENVNVVPDTSWSESGITYFNKPAISSTSLGTVSGRNTNSWYSYNFTQAAVQPNVGRLFSFAVQAPSYASNYLEMQSRESYGYEPQLIITYTPAAQIVPTNTPAPLPTATPVLQLATPTPLPPVPTATNIPGVPTAIPTQIPASTPTPVVTSGPVPTPLSGTTSLRLSLRLHGIGSGGDNVNPSSRGNFSPAHAVRTATVSIYDVHNQLVVNQVGNVSFDAGSGTFIGNVDLGTNFVTGSYTVKVKADQFLRTLIPGIQTITANQSNVLPSVALVTGDTNNDNQVNIVDYNMIVGCYSDLQAPVDCAGVNNQLADITDDGHVNQFDYNLFLRELTNIGGQ